MPVAVRIDPGLSLVVVVFEGVVSREDFSEKLGPLLESPRFNSARLSLFDATGLTAIEADSEVIRSLAHRAIYSVDEAVGPGSRMAVVASNDEAFGLARMYELLRGDTPVEIVVFRAMPEAEAWLELPEGYEAGLEEVVLA